MQIFDNRFALHKIGDHNIAFEISDSDETTITRYYGYLSSKGAWIIQCWDTTANTYRYAAGSELYAANWTARATLTYVYYSQLT